MRKPVNATDRHTRPGGGPRAPRTSSTRGLASRPQRDTGTAATPISGVPVIIPAYAFLVRRPTDSHPWAEIYFAYPIHAERARELAHQCPHRASDVIEIDFIEREASKVESRNSKTFDINADVSRVPLFIRSATTDDVRAIWNWWNNASQLTTMFEFAEFLRQRQLVV